VMGSLGFANFWMKGGEIKLEKSYFSEKIY
jgi:hypothetical protein